MSAVTLRHPLVEVPLWARPESVVILVELRGPAKVVVVINVEQYDGRAVGEVKQLPQQSLVRVPAGERGGPINSSIKWFVDESEAEHPKHPWRHG